MNKQRLINFIAGLMSYVGVVVCVFALLHPKADDVEDLIGNLFWNCVFALIIWIPVWRYGIWQCRRSRKQ
jgi:hypothetical protein